MARGGEDAIASLGCGDLIGGAGHRLMGIGAAISVLWAFSLLAASCHGGQPKRVPREVALQRLQKLGLDFSQNSFVKTAIKGDVDELGLYLDAGVDPNGEDDKGTTALYAAASAGNDEAIRFLIARGAAPKRRARSNEGEPVRIGWTPLGVATVTASAGTVETLLECGADPNELDGLGDPPAWYAVAPEANDQSYLARLRYTKPNVECLRVLLDAGADVNARGNNGDTLLVRAVAKSGPETVALLVEKGANVNLTGEDGKSPKQRAEERGDTNIMALLKKAGA